MNVLNPVVRTAAFFGKELREVIRRPGVLISVVVGPFLIMFLFGMGTTGFRDAIATEIVIPPDAELSRDPEFYASLVGGRIRVVQIGEDAAAAESRLRSGDIDLLIVAPEGAAEKLRSGEQTTIRVAWNEIDPLADAFTYALTSILVGNVNAEIIEQAAAGGIALVEEETGDTVTIPAEVIARPSTAETENVAPTEPSVINFYGPAVLALVIQHLGVSLTALSLVRERRGGQIDRYRVAPVGAAEILIGKYLAYGLIAAVTGVAVAALLVGVLGVPVIGGWLAPAAIAGLLAFAALGAGIVISLLADSERQAVQLSMLLLLASVFLSGLVLPVTDFAWWIEPIAYLLPVTHGIAALQESMLRGALQSVLPVVVLAGMAAVFYLAAVVLLRRELRSEA